MSSRKAPELLTNEQTIAKLRKQAEYNGDEILLIEDVIMEHEKRQQRIRLENRKIFNIIDTITELSD